MNSSNKFDISAPKSPTSASPRPLPTTPQATQPKRN
jgi:hypothetical protein